MEAVLLDYGGVIADEGFQNGLRALAQEQDLDVTNMMDVARLGVYESGFILGRGSAEEFWAYMRKGTGLSGSDAELTRRVLEGFTLRPWMIEQIRQWRAGGYLTAILSDQSHWLDQLDERDHFFDYFDHVFNSYYLGKGKKDPSLFTDVADMLSLPPSALLFVDDNVDNVTRARDMGLNAIHYVDQDSFMVEMGKWISGE